MKISYLSLNIWLGGKLWDTMIEFLLEQNADIMAFQEVYDGHDLSSSKQLRSFDELQKLFPDHQAVFAPAAIDKKSNTEMGNAVFSRFPITSHSPVFFDVPFGVSSSTVEDAEFFPRNMCRAEVAINTKQLFVYSWHGIWGVDGEDNPRRLQMSETIINEIQDKPHVILSGDTNMKPHTESAKRIDAVLPSVFGETLKSTFNMRQKTHPGFADAAVDMLFTSPTLTVHSAACLDIDVSDHLPLVASISLPDTD